MLTACINHDGPVTLPASNLQTNRTLRRIQGRLQLVRRKIGESQSIHNLMFHLAGGKKMTKSKKEWLWKNLMVITFISILLTTSVTAGRAVYQWTPDSLSNPGVCYEWIWDKDENEQALIDYYFTLHYLTGWNIPIVNFGLNSFILSPHYLFFFYWLCIYEFFSLSVSFYLYILILCQIYYIIVIS